MRGISFDIPVGTAGKLQKRDLFALLEYSGILHNTGMERLSQLRLAQRSH